MDARPPLEKSFQRAYKACVTCRKRKSRCILSAEDYTAGRPCARCRREMKDCVFVPEKSRSQPRTHKPGSPASPTTVRANIRSPQDVIRSPENVVRDVPVQQQRDSLVRNVISRPNDALNLLFEAATHHSSRMNDAESPTTSRTTQPYPSLRTPQSTPAITRSSRLPDGAIGKQVWKACRFVRTGWFSAAEAAYLVEMFYKTMSPLTPTVPDFYRDPAMHYHLVTQEPMLCCTILCLSSRYNVLPGPGGSSRSYLIHKHLWDHCQQLILRVMLGHENSTKNRTRTMGTLEALLLLTEWHARELHFPPPDDGYDSDILRNTPDVNEEFDDGQEQQARVRWLEDVIMPAKKSDRMSWMLVSCAMSLAHELGIFEDQTDEDDGRDGSKGPDEERLCEQRFRLRKLLYLYVEHLSSRLGCMSIMLHTLSHTIGPTTSPTNGPFRSSNEWQAFVNGWVELTKTGKSIADTLFPSSALTKHLVRTGRYIGLIQHFQNLLVGLKERHLMPPRPDDHLYDALCIEYQYARIYGNALGLQAVVERTIASRDQNSNGEPLSAASVDPIDFGFIQEVVDGSLEILQIAIKLANTGILIFSPVRIFLRITSASIFLLKGLSLGIGANKLHGCLDTLGKAIAALRTGSLDDMHLGSRYATLIEMHVGNLRASFVPSTRPIHFSTSSAPFERDIPHPNTGAVPNEHFYADSPTPSNNNIGLDANGLQADNPLNIEDWLSLPFDPSMGPIVPGDSQVFPWIADGSLDFIWNLDT